MGRPSFVQPHGAQSAPGTSAYNAFSAEDEWEYEYDEDEAEDFFFTLDLTTHVPDALAQKLAPESAKRRAQVNPYARKSTSVGTDDRWQTAAEGALDEDDGAGNRLQIIDLHTKNPLVKLDDGVYSCYWSTDLGTQFHITQAGVTTTPRRAGTVLDVVGLSRTRLTGKPVQIHEKNGTRKPQEVGAAFSDAIGVEDSSDNDFDPDAQSDWSTRAPSVYTAPSEPLKIDRVSCKTRSAEGQASFLERLSEIKLKKGETDQVPPFAIRQYAGPSKAAVEVIKREKLASDARKRQREEDDQRVITDQRPRKRRRKLTYAEKGLDGLESGKLAGRQSREAISARIGFQDGRVPEPEPINGTSIAQSALNALAGTPNVINEFDAMMSGGLATSDLGHVHAVEQNVGSAPVRSLADADCPISEPVETLPNAQIEPAGVPVAIDSNDVATSEVQSQGLLSALLVGPHPESYSAHSVMQNAQEEPTYLQAGTNKPEAEVRSNEAEQTFPARPTDATVLDPLTATNTLAGVTALCSPHYEPTLQPMSGSTTTQEAQLEPTETSAVTYAPDDATETDHQRRGQTSQEEASGAPLHTVSAAKSDLDPPTSVPTEDQANDRIAADREENESALPAPSADATSPTIPALHAANTDSSAIQAKEPFVNIVRSACDQNEPTPPTPSETAAQTQPGIDQLRPENPDNRPKTSAAAPAPTDMTGVSSAEADETDETEAALSTPGEENVSQVSASGPLGTAQTSQVPDRIDSTYVENHPNETFYHMGRGRWAQGLPPLGSNPRTAVKGPGAKEWKEVNAQAAPNPNASKASPRARS